MGYKRTKRSMKKSLMVALLALVSVIAMAVPSGYYQNSRGRGVHISGSTFSVCNRDGDVIARWEIVNESNGVLSLRSSLGAVATASWWSEDGEIYLNWNYDTYVRK